ncbi:alpha/beta hydrolase [Dyadobacter bucti]|uniref:alpha/beta hydrolase n=1 Tax=Dyadobacter bucti TaxID=2572203 RepID=UPI0011096065|nr:alpha/beta hydrolase [Dyadobacter bucti]
MVALLIFLLVISILNLILSVAVLRAVSIFFRSRPADTHYILASAKRSKYIEVLVDGLEYGETKRIVYNARPRTSEDDIFTWYNDLNKDKPTIKELLFVTDRKFVADPESKSTISERPNLYIHAKKYYGTEGVDYPMGYELGRCWVSIPKSHKYGGLEKPFSVFGLQLEAESDQDHIVFKGLEKFTYEYFCDYLKSHGGISKSALVYIHGYNTSFDDAAKRTAQMVYDLNFGGIGMFYSWPSQEKTVAYPVDSANIPWTEIHLTNFLQHFSNIEAIENLYIIAHSMGTRLVENALTARKQRGNPKQVIRELILAAPDIDERIFKEKIAPILPGVAERTTVYRSGDDVALLASHKFNGFARLGDVRNGINTYKQIDMIDATGFKTDFLGHSDYASSPELLYDINGVLAGKPISERPRLLKEEHDPVPYWRIYK